MPKRPKLTFEVSIEDKTSEGAREVERRLIGLKGAFKAVIGAATTATFAKLTTDTAKATAAIADFAERLPISAQGLAELQFVAEQTGVSVSQLNLILQRQTRRISEAAAGSKPLIEAFNELGLSANDLVKLRADQAFGVLADAFNNLENESDKLRIAVKLLDTEGAGALQTFRLGSSAIKDLRTQYRSFGGVLTSEVVANARATNDELSKTRAIFKATARELVTIFGPAVQSVSNLLGITVPKAASLATRAVIKGRAAFAQFAGTIAGVFGNERAAQNLKELSDAYERELERIKKGLSDLDNEFGDGVKASDLLDNSLKNQRTTVQGLTEDWSRFDKTFREVKQLYEDTRTPAERLYAQLERYTQLLNDQVIQWDLYQRAVKKAVGEFQDASTQTEKTAEETTTNTQKLLEDIKVEIEGTSRAIVDSIFTSSNDIKDIFRDLVNELAKLAVKRLVTDPLVGIASGFLKNIFGGFFGGGGGQRQFGGPVTGGRPYLVGESGPEVFVPQGQGEIVPAAGGQTNVNFTINTLDGRQAANVLVENKNVITSIIRDSFRRTGQEVNLA